MGVLGWVVRRETVAAEMHVYKLVSNKLNIIARIKNK